MKKKISLIVVLMLVCIFAVTACLAGCNDANKKGGDDNKVEAYNWTGAKNNDFKVGGTVILGNSTELSGDFRYAGAGSSSAGAADQDIKGLVSGYGTMELDRNGDYQWNQIVVKSHDMKEVTNADGESKDLLVTIEINSGLKLSDGTELKAANYLAYILAFSSPVGDKAIGFKTAGMNFVGYKAFLKYDGTNGSDEGVSAAFAGIRLLGDYKFSLQIDGAEGYYPYYYADTYGAITPYDVKLVLGEGVEVKDDGQGAYLTSAWYAKTDDKFNKVEQITTARDCNDETYAFTGPYVIKSYDESKKEATLKLNPNYAGNWEGQKPHVETIIYRHVIDETQNTQLSKGEIDVLEAITGGDEVTSALKVMNDAPAKFASVHYDRAGYGKIEFECDFGPCMFPEVRQAVAYCLDRADFANTFTGGYGSLVNGPYSVNFGAYISQEDAIEAALKSYAVSVAKAKETLIAGGWTYNSKGENLGANWAAGTGVDQVRYKKLAEGEYGVDDVNKTYKAVSVATIGGVEYKTVKVGDDYYMPLVINWGCSENNPVSALLTTKLQQGNNVKEAGMAISKTEMPFTNLLGEIYREASYGYDGTPKYGMLNLATGWNNGMYDYSYNWIGADSDLYDDFFEYSSNKLTDPYDADFQWDKAENKYLSYDEAVAKSNGKLGMNYISFAMVYSVKAGDVTEYNKWFKAYMIRWNELLPDIPLYSNIYYDVFNRNILNYKTSPFFGAADAILYCACKDAQ